VRSHLVSERTAVINQIRGFLLERGVIVRQGLRFLRQQLPDILTKRTDVLSPRMVRIVTDLAGIERSRRYLWRLGLLLLVVIPFLPEIVIYLTVALAEIMGCQPNQNSACLMTARIWDTATDEVIAEIRSRERNGVIELPKRKLKAGDRVQIVSGLLADRRGYYAGESRKHIKVLLQMLGIERQVQPCPDAIEQV
jgi:hypothetical protein